MDDEEFDVCATCNSEATCRWQGECMGDLEAHFEGGYDDDEDFDIPPTPDSRELRAML